MGLEDGAGNQRQGPFRAQEKVLQSIGSTPLGVLKEEVAGASSGLKQPTSLRQDKLRINKRHSHSFLPGLRLSYPTRFKRWKVPALGTNTWPH